jgi:proteic killer suppression protein
LIKSFKHKGLAKLYEKADKKGLSSELIPKIERILARLDIATCPEMMNLPGYRLHQLKGEMKGFWSVSVSGNWRIVFYFEEFHVFDVDLVDYH